MCGKAPKPPPPVVQRDPIAEQAKAEAQAAQQSNADSANRRRRQALSGNGMVASAMRAATMGSAGAGPSLLRQATPKG